MANDYKNEKYNYTIRIHVSKDPYCKNCWKLQIQTFSSFACVLTFWTVMLVLLDNTNQMLIINHAPTYLQEDCLWQLFIAFILLRNYKYSIEILWIIIAITWDWVVII